MLLTGLTLDFQAEAEASPSSSGRLSGVILSTNKRHSFIANNVLSFYLRAKYS